MPRINKGMGIGSAGFWVGFHALTDAQKWPIVNYIDEQAVPPPRDSTLRVRATRISRSSRTAAPLGIEIKDGRVLLDTTRGRLAFDFLILATGLTVDWSQRPELAALKDRIQLWGDHFMPEGHSEFAQADHPFVGPAFEFLERAPGTAPWVEPHSLLHLSGLSEPRSDLGRHPGDQHRRGARRATASRARCSPRITSGRGGAWPAWSNPELRGDEYVLAEDVSPFLADQPEKVKP